MLLSNVEASSSLYIILNTGMSRVLASSHGESAHPTVQAQRPAIVRMLTQVSIAIQ